MEEETTLDLRDFYYILKKRFKLIVLVTVACTLLAGILSFFVIKPTYEAGTTIIVGKPQNSQKSNTQYNDVMMYQNLVKTYAQIAGSNAVMESASNKMNGSVSAGQLKSIITVTPQQGTQILEIKGQSKDPSQAVNMVNAVSNSFITESKRVFPTGGDIQIMDKPQFPNKPVKPKKVLNMAIAFFVGLMGSIGFSFMLEYMDNTIKTEEDVNKILGIPVIGIIPKGNM
ncbi:YveK family protein [Clostridium autoethanogenum]|jgi:capsular polysaccharide biosynthesis protein|uniref:Wzz/FepE/Etk N-terminal domain-containing protein n=1 Tax=Clostridium autoethanogenum DSM 10061 TaxID=1341692 RepID=A0ABM5NWF9_9CLOT|nr:Wzz/FepE/Etk N-terminal domain-containing protein [Clostridium autoethanogenum]AGY76800.1 Wzz/FepE/Etk N-terminal domain-containing protein [Clostridium autoethanogenum DSM 10061]ALU36954.1 Capsular biosynthesis protein [Clostridium autoethanogenum DSM 10061]OVY50356.1 Capsular polysaccharide type 8 biosynthesis protein cap8A [Clostridium autoethanogenum]